MEQWNTHEGIAEEKALVLLSALHALRFPDVEAHSRRFEPYERKYVPLDAEYVYEAVITRGGLDVVAKEKDIQKEIRAQFRGVFPKGLDVPRGSAYDYVLSVCEAARHRFHAEDDLPDPKQRLLSSEAILPGPEVIEAMAEDFVRHKRESCPQLEEFIAQFRGAA